MIREKIAKLIENTIKTLQKEGVFDIFEVPEVVVEYSKEKTHGDYSISIALHLAKIIKKSPMEIAKILESRIKNMELRIFEEIETKEPGFINFFISPKYLQQQIKEILKQKEKFGELKIGKGRKVHPVKSSKAGVPLEAEQFDRVNVEFISANPTGPLTLGNGRGGFCGDVLANVLEKASHKVTREYYINDIGEQIKKLGHSVLGDEQAVYKGEYINSLRKKLLGERVSQLSVEKVGEKAVKIILKEMIKPSVKKMGIKFDVWFSEKSLYQKGEVDKVIQEITKKGFIYKSEGAVWFKCKNLGDDKDRVLIRKDGIKTYFASDIAYLKNKFKRGFKQLVLFLGADHYGYVARLRAATQALGFGKERINTIVMQMVRLFQGGKEVRMSKRTGTYITINELIDEVGLDVARFFFLMRSPDTHLNFDMDLAKEQSAENPVYYVQYAYARISSILRKCKIQNANLKMKMQNSKLLNHPAELELIKQLIKLPEIIEDTAKDFQVQRLPQYAIELADAFHKFYENCRVINDDKNLTQARLGLALATKIVLKNSLSLMGVSSPEKM